MENIMAKESTPKPPVLEKPDHVNEQNAGGFGDDVENELGNDPDFEQPNDSQKTVTPAVNNQDPTDFMSALFDSPAFAKLVAAEVEKRVAAQSDDGSAGKTRFIDSSQQRAAVQAPDFKFLKHYRCDTSPELTIQELNMDAEVPQLEPLVGRKIRFRRGHFYATTENQVKQLDTMMHMATHSADGRSVLGGVVGVYEDEDEVLYYCQAGCGLDQFVPTASKKKYAAHMRAAHNVIVEV